MVTLPILTRLAIAGYGLFPGEPAGTGIDRSFEPGLTLIAGINGLGKTTLLTAILRALTGPFDLTGDGPPPEMGVSMPERPVALRRKPAAFFRQRVADEARDATVALDATFGDRVVNITRRLDDLALIELKVGGELRAHSGSRADREEAFQSELADLMGLGSFADVLLLLHHLMLFQEDRPGALWDENAQRQILRALFLEKADSIRVAELERLVQTADSQARNIQTRITATEKDLRDALRLEAANLADAAHLEAEQKLLDADLAEQRRVDVALEDLEGERRRVRLELERAKIAQEEATGAVERIKYSALATLYPSMEEASRLVIARILTQGRCLVCDSDAEAKRQELEAMLAEGRCPACGAPPDEQHNVVGQHKFEQAKLDAAQAAAKLADDEVEAKSGRLREAGESHRALTVKAAMLRGQIDDRLSRNARLRRNLPGGVTSQEIRNALTTLRRQHREWSTTLATHVLDLSTLLGDKEGAISTRAHGIIDSFAELTGRLLAEPARLAEVELQPRYTQAQDAVAGARLHFPAFKAEMTAANRTGYVRRDDTSDVSESQRELIDLAFRLALVRSAAPDAGATFVMETPEASLDGIAMGRVGAAMAEFAADRDNRLIVTSNLSNAGLITALFGGRLAPEEDAGPRRRRTLNLLRTAAPNRALVGDRAAYERLLEEALTGRDGNS